MMSPRGLGSIYDVATGDAATQQDQAACAAPWQEGCAEYAMAGSWLAELLWSGWSLVA